MNRFPPIPEADMDADQRRMSTKASRSGPYHAFMHAPRMWEALQIVRQYLARESDLSLAAREMVMLAAAVHWRSAAAIAAHRTMAREAGIPDTVIERIISGESCGNAVAENDAMVLELARSLLAGGAVEDDLFSRGEARIGRKGIVEITGLIGFFTTICLTLNVAAIDPEQPGANSNK